MCSKNWYFCCQLILHYLFAFISPLFALPPEFLHKLNRGFWCHGDGDLNFQLKSSSTNLRVAHKGKAETILFNILSKNSFYSKHRHLLSAKIVPHAFWVPKFVFQLIQYSFLIIPIFKWKRIRCNCKVGAWMSDRFAVVTPQPPPGNNFQLMQLSFVLSTLILTMIFIRGNP